MVQRIVVISSFKFWYNYSNPNYIDFGQVLFLKMRQQLMIDWLAD